MSKTLSTIQTISKIGKILSKIVFIFCIIGAIGSLIGFLSITLSGDKIMELGKIKIHGFVEISESINKGNIYTALSIGLIASIGSAVIAKLFERYFKNELDAGTPFTFDGSKELQQLGIISLGISIGVSILNGITAQIIKSLTDGVTYEIEDSISINIGLCLVILIVSLICRYGAELTEKKAE